MAEICSMIEQTWHARQAARQEQMVKPDPRQRNWAMPWLYATRLHALLDCYAALGGDVSLWRKSSGVLR